MSAIVNITFDQSFIYGDGGIHSFSVSKIIKECQKKYGYDSIHILDQQLEQCEFELDVQLNDRDIKVEIEQLLKEKISDDISNYKLAIKMDGDMNPEIESEGVSEEELRDEPENRIDEKSEEKQKEPSVIENIDHMVGAQDFKRLGQELFSRLDTVIKNHTESVFFNQAYLFAVNQGEGYTYSLELLAGLLQEKGLFDNKKTHEIIEVILPSPADNKVESTIRNITQRMNGNMKGENIFSYDISAWLGHTAKPSFKNLLLTIFRDNKNCIHVFRIPVVSESLIKQTKEDISDILYVKNINFMPFTSDEQHQIAGRMLEEYEMTVENDSWKLFDERIAKERADGYFYGIHTIRKIANEMVQLLEEYNLKNNLDNKLITAEKIRALMPERKEETMHGEESLNALIGMEEVKTNVRNIIAQIEMSRKSGSSQKPTMHMCFVGNPGTGKTTVARLIGQILNEKGLLRIGKFYEYKGRDLCGKYVGHTAAITTEICREAYGSILFIDEAYSLFRGDFGSNDFGREAMDTLVAEMENHSDDLIVIFAGYPSDIERMLSWNAGMKSRIPYTLHFPDYTQDELFEIFMQRVSQDFESDKEFTNHVKQYFEMIPNDVIGRSDFGNARFVRNLYERMWGRTMARLAETDESANKKVLPEDFDAAAKEFDFREKETRVIGF